MRKKTVWISVVFAAAVLSYLMISSFTPNRARCEVCMEFNGGTDCRTASAETRDNALRTAITNACAQLSSGIVQSSQCENTPPRSVRWLR
jgi:preprotein translocase subunit SecF